MYNEQSLTTRTEWKLDHVLIYDSEIQAYRKIYTAKEAKILLTQTKDPFIRFTASLYALVFNIKHSREKEPILLLKQLILESDAYKQLLGSKEAALLLDRIVAAGRQSITINGLKTDVFHEAVRLSIEMEEYYSLKQTS